MNDSEFYLTIIAANVENYSDGMMFHLQSRRSAMIVSRIDRSDDHLLIQDTGAVNIRTFNVGVIPTSDIDSWYNFPLPIYLRARSTLSIVIDEIYAFGS